MGASAIRLWRLSVRLEDGKGGLWRICTRLKGSGRIRRVRKKLDETHVRPLVWGEIKTALEKVCTIHMVGGLDQMFREFLLASQVTRLLIIRYGHG
jgi:hypothetical protein